jgi:diguanylate cyclase (GGDEF)-like protein
MRLAAPAMRFPLDPLGDMQTPTPNSNDRRSAMLRSPRLLIGAGVVFAVAMLSVVCAILYGGRQDAMEHAIESSSNTLLVLEQDIDHDITRCDLSLQAVVDGAYRPDVMAASPLLRRAILFDRSTMLPYLRAILVTDATGRIVIDSRTDVPPKGNLANADFFEVQRDRPAWGLYVSPPRASQLLNGEKVLYLSRRITAPDGSFLGIVLGAVSVEYFHQLLAGLKIGSHGSAALIHTDGIFVMRVPDGAANVGHKLRRSGPFLKMMRSAEGTFTDTASVDGVRRVYTFKHLSGLPLIANVAPAEIDIYAHWKTRAERVGAVMALYCAAFIGVAILLVRALGEKAKAESALRKLAQTDSLTGLANRRALDEILEREWRRAVRAHRPLSALFVDLDRFKAYNDQYGHQAGDDALAAVGRCLEEHVRRPGDVVARYGGEEFVVVLPDTDSVAALSIADSLREAVASLAIEHLGSEQGKVTVSIGAASWQGVVAENVSSVVKAADEALYRAKAVGRNCVSAAILA